MRLAGDQRDAPNRLEIYVSRDAFGSSWDLLSMPSKPDASTKPLADRPKLSRVAALAATFGKFWLAAPPPIDKINLR